MHSAWRGIKVFSDHAFVVSEAIDHGMQVFDLRQLRNVPAPPVTFTETAHYAGFGSTHTLAHEQTHGIRVRRRHTYLRRRFARGRRAHARVAAGGWLFQLRRLHARNAMRHLQRARHGPSRPRGLFQLERRHADHRRRHRQARTGPAVTDRLRRQRIHAPGMAHRGSAVLPGQRRRRRERVQACDANVDLGRVGPRRAVHREHV